MRYLYNHTLMEHYHGQWAGTKPLITASCFFWTPGAELQKSQIGLLRTLLVELLQQVPAFIKSIRLAVMNLLQGLRNEDRIEDLKKKVKSYGG